MSLQDAFRKFQARPQTQDAYLQTQGWNPMESDGRTSYGRRNSEGSLEQYRPNDEDYLGLLQDPQSYIQDAGYTQLKGMKPTDMGSGGYAKYGTIDNFYKTKLDPGGHWAAPNTEENPFDDYAWWRSPQYDYSHEQLNGSDENIGLMIAMLPALMAGGVSLFGAEGLLGAGAGAAGEFGAGGLAGLAEGGAFASEAGFLPGSFELGASGYGGTASAGLDAAGLSGLAEGAPWGANLRGGEMDLFDNWSNVFEGDFSGFGEELSKSAVSGLSAGTGGGGGTSLSSLFQNMLSPQSLLRTGLGLGSSLLQNSAIGKAVDAQTGAADRATAATLAMYDQNRADLAPWRTAGGGAVTRLSDLLTPGKQVTTMEMDPGYQFRMDQGQKLRERSAAAKGKLFSPGTVNAIQRYGQDYSSNEFTNVANRLSNLAGLGQTATNTTAALGANAVNQQSENIIGAGNSRASGYIGGANAITGSLSNLLRGFQEEEMLRQLLAMR